MNQYEHLPLPIFQGDVPRQTRGRGGGFKPPAGRNNPGNIKKEYFLGGRRIYAIKKCFLAQL